MAVLTMLLRRFWPVALAIAVQGALLSAPSVTLSQAPLPDREQFFLTVNSPVGLAVNPSGIGYVTRPLCGSTRQVMRFAWNQFNAAVNVTVLATLPSFGAGDPVCYEHKIVVSPGPQNNAGSGEKGYPTLSPAGFVSNEIYVTSPKNTQVGEGVQRALTVIKIGLDLTALYNQHIVRYLPPTTFATFSTTNCDKNASTGIAFDEVGTFNFKLIVVCSNPAGEGGSFGGKVFALASDGTGTTTPVATISTSFAAPFERPVVAPSGGPFGGNLLIPAENAQFDAPGLVLSVPPGGCEGPCSTTIANIPSAEAVAIKPATTCNFGQFNLAAGAIYFAAKSGATPGGNRIDFIPRAPFTGTSGQAYVISENAEGGVGIWRLTQPNTAPIAFSASTTTHEDAGFVDCFVPTIIPVKITRSSSTVAVAASSTPGVDAGRYDFNNSLLIPFDPNNPQATSNAAGVKPIPGSCKVVTENDNSQGSNNNQGQINVLHCTFPNNLPNGGTGHGVFKAPVVDPAGPGDGAEGGC